MRDNNDNTSKRNKKSYGINLRQRMILLVLSGLILPLVILSIYMNLSTKNILATQEKETEHTALVDLGSNIQKDVKGGMDINSLVEKYSPILRERDQETYIFFSDGVTFTSKGITQPEEEILTVKKKVEPDIYNKDMEYKGRQCLISSVRIENQKPGEYFTLLSIQSYSDIYGEADAQISNSLLYIVIGILPSILLIFIFASRFSRRLNAFQVQMHKTAAGDFQIVKMNGSHDEISVLYEDLNAMISSIQHLLSTVYEEQVQKEKLNSRQKDVEFKMLASQINPHFLYNTLETIRMKARCSGEDEIEELVKMLAKIMRRNIQVGDNLVTLKSELELVEYYLKIQQYRFGDRINYRIELNCNIEFLKIMPLIIQPVVENAFIHGLETKEGEGEIRIIVERTDRLRIHVIDNGIGMSKEKLEEITESLNDTMKLDRSHIGLSNVNQRIKLLYGEEYGIYIDSAAGRGTTVIIELPEDMSQ